MSRIFGVLLFENFELLDVFGPLELFGILGVDRIEVVLIAQSEGLVKSKQGPAVLAEFSFENAPAIDILLVPGGQGTRIEVLNQTLLNWIQRVSRSAELTLSVCTGAALLAKAGILNGHQATTNKASFQWVSEQKYESEYFTANIEDNNIIDTTKEIDWVYVARWVESGNVWTSSGVSAGMDMSIAIITQLYGIQTRESVLKHAEYTPHIDKNVDPFALQRGAADV